MENTFHLDDAAETLIRISKSNMLADEVQQCFEAEYEVPFGLKTMIKLPKDGYTLRLKFPGWKDMRELRVEEVGPDALERMIYLQVAVHADGCLNCNAREEQVRTILNRKKVPYGTIEEHDGSDVSRFYRLCVPAAGRPAEHLIELLELPISWSPIKWEIE